MEFHLVLIPVRPSCAHPLLLWVLPVLLRLAVRASLTATLLAMAEPAAVSHVGHGDEFQQQGDGRQVKRNAESDGLLGVATAKPESGPDGLTVPSTALVDAKGQPLLFVQTETTYDPVIVETGDSQGDRVVVTEGIDPTDDVVISGALSLYAESMKTQQAEPAMENNKQLARAASKTATNAALPVPALAAGGAVLLAAGAIWLSRRKQTDA